MVPWKKKNITIPSWWPSSKSRLRCVSGNVFCISLDLLVKFFWFFGEICVFCRWHCVDFLVKLFGFVGESFEFVCEIFGISQTFVWVTQYFFWFLKKIGFLSESFWISWWFVWISLVSFVFLGDFFWIYRYLMHPSVGHTTWAPEGCKGRSQAGPKCHQLEVGPIDF